ncbi:unnamed protein product [Rhizopus stolonifer]
MKEKIAHFFFHFPHTFLFIFCSLFEKILLTSTYKFRTILKKQYNTMDLRIYQEDGHVNAVDEHGNEPVEMEVDVDDYPLANTVDFDSYMEFKPPEKLEASTKANKKVSAAASGPISYYKKHGDDVKGHFFYLVYEEGLTAGKAGKQLGIARRTAYD